VLVEVTQVPFIVDQCEQILESRMQRLPPGAVRLPSDPALAVVSYTYDLGYNSTHDYGDDNLFKALNILLRERNGMKMRLLKPFLSFLMEGMSLLPAVAGKMKRGVPGTDENLQLMRMYYKMGMDVHWSSFTSTTTSLDKAKQFAEGPGGIIFRIEVLYGRSVAAYSAIPDEAEILLSPNTRLVVTGECTLDPSDGYYYIDMVERRDDKFVF
jgi:hypothetical protein